MNDAKIDLRPISEEIIGVEYKGLPLSAIGKTVREFLNTKPNLFGSDFQFPIMVLKDEALKHNIRRMADFCKEHKVDLVPHVKTPMSPQIAKMQLDAGAWGITVANFNQANIFLKFGFNRIIIGNEVLEPTAIKKIAELNYSNQAEIFFYIDSISALKFVMQAINDLPNAKINLLLEIGFPNSRAGIRNLKDIDELLARIKDEPKIVVHGVSGFEGAVPDGDREKGEAEVRKFLKLIVEAAKVVAPITPNKVIISAGGSSYFDYVVDEFSKFEGDCHIILRSGGYVSHDHVHYENLYPFMKAETENRFMPALEIWSRVLSLPEPGFGILNFGKRDAGNDLDNPIPIKTYTGKIERMQAEIEKLNDQHAFLRFKEGNLEVAQLIGCGISHPCTNFDKWRLIPLVDSNYDVVDLIHTYF